MSIQRSLSLIEGIGKKRNVLSVVLGWYGCTPRQLRRHANVFTDAMHTDTAVYAPCMAVASFPLVGRHAARSLANVIIKYDEQQHQQKKNDLVFLVMSGHGENLLHHFILEQGNTIDLKRIRGVVHDSAPVRPNADLWSQAATAAAVSKLPKFMRPNTPVYHLPIITPICRATSAAHMALPWNAKWIRDSQTASRALYRVYDSKDGCGHHEKCILPKSLFMYSDSDPVVDADNVHSSMKTLRNLHSSHGCKCPECCIRECFFTGSNHVDHLRTHPKRYVDALSRFFKDCIDC